MLDEFLIRAGLAAIGVALAAGPIGCFVVWRRMAYFGDTTAHAAILGVALSLAFSFSVTLGVLIVALGVAVIVSGFSGRIYGSDTILGVIAHSALALGLVVMSFVSGSRIDLMAYLFGDVLTVSWQEVWIIWVGALGILALLRWRWRGLMLATLSDDLARAHGISPRKEQLILMLTLAVLVAIAIKVVGALLITALLIIPAAAARPLAETPQKMAVFAAVMGGLSTGLGLAFSSQSDAPAGPAIVVMAAVVFCLANLAGRIRKVDGL